MVRPVYLILLFLATASAAVPSISAQQPQSGAASTIQKLEYAPAPLDNPLKGLVPYWKRDWYDKPFPCSMEFWYFRANELMVASDRFDWGPVESKLSDMQRRGHQAVLRIYLEFPGRPSAVPKFLLDQGVKLNRYQSGGKVNLTPDYDDERLVQAMERLIAGFGQRYDGDPRIGFLTMGFLGQWGEWHTFPRGDLFASKATQMRIQKAFAASFKKTKVLMRYPAGEGHATYAPNAKTPFGYHDDSFSWATLDSGNPADDWYFVPLLKAAGASEKWKVAPIGGEIRPELWGCVFDEPSCAAKEQAFDKCIVQTHASWLMDSGMFDEGERNGKISPGQRQKRIANAKRNVAKLGYELFISEVSMELTGEQQTIRLRIDNRGVAPFYYDWPVEFAQLKSTAAGGFEISKVHSTSWRLSNVLPGKVSEWKITVPRMPKSGFAIRVPNPMTGGKPLRFANQRADQSERDDGWLVLEKPVK